LSAEPPEVEVPEDAPDIYHKFEAFKRSLTARNTLALLDENETEISGAGYRRAVIEWDIDSSGVATNKNSVGFPTAMAEWGMVSGFAAYNAAGMEVFRSHLSVPRAVSNGDRVCFPKGSVSFSME
jgi:hypothetical protein